METQRGTFLTFPNTRERTHSFFGLFFFIHNKWATRTISNIKGSVALRFLPKNINQTAVLNFFSWKMTSLRCGINWKVVTVFIRVLGLISMSMSCSVFKATRYVTMDTSICLFQNYTEQVPELACIKLCYNHSAVSTISWYYILSKIRQYILPPPTVVKKR